MARNRIIRVGAINLRAHPHPSGVYRSLLDDAFELRKPVRVQGDRHMLMRSIDGRDDEVITGTFARFTELDPHLPWFDLEKLDEAGEELVKKISIPANVRPNYKLFHYGYFLKTHVLVFEHYGTSGGISPKIVHSFFMNLLEDESITQKYKEIEIDVISDADKLSDILGLHHLKSLSIRVNRPNPDGVGGLDARVDARLNGMGAKSLEESYDAAPERDLVPDEEAREMANLAMANGSVRTEGLDIAGKKIKMSSDEHPVIETQSYDPDDLTERQAFNRAARTLIQRLANYLI
tara:strand:+ start:1035 stop:1910 length:876 start_codon:yes stop_codon:yes gene_type:complete